MTRRQQQYSAWGSTKTLRRRIESRDGLPAYAMCGEYESGVESVTRAIGRRLGLAVCGCTPQGMALPERSRHYSITLGTPLRSGGYDVVGEMWIAIPAADPTE